MSSSDPVLFAEISALLNDSAFEVFATIFNLELRAGAPADVFAGEGAPIAATVGVVGDVNLTIGLHLQVPFACGLTRHFLRLDETAAIDDTMINDVVGEVSNMILGSVKSRLCAQGRTCTLTLPVVHRGKNSPTPTSLPGDATGQLSLACGKESIRLDLLLRRSA